MVNDLAGLSAPITRLIEVVSNGVGAVLGPTMIRRKAKAQAEQIRLIAGAVETAGNNSSVPVTFNDGTLQITNAGIQVGMQSDGAIDERVLARVEHQERKRQQNLERITAIAADELSGTTEVPDQSPDDDWVARFFSGSQDISSEQMQKLWGKVLAGEIRKPGQFSLRTLDFLRNLSIAEAKFFELLAPFAMRVGKVGDAFVAMHNPEVLKKSGVTDGLFLRAANAGVLFPNQIFQTLGSDGSKPILLQNRGLCLLCSLKEGKRVSIPIWGFTPAAAEIMCDLVSAQPNDEYVKSLAASLMIQGVDVSLGNIVSVNPSQVQVKDLKKLRLEPVGDSPAAPQKH